MVQLNLIVYFSVFYYSRPFFYFFMSSCIIFGGLVLVQLIITFCSVINSFAFKYISVAKQKSEEKQDQKSGKTLKILGKNYLVWKKGIKLLIFYVRELNWHEQFAATQLVAGILNEVLGWAREMGRRFAD